MFRNLSWKLTLAFMAVAMTTAILIAVSIRLTSASRLSQLIVDQQISSLQTTLSNYYITENNSWEGVAANWSQMQLRTFPTPSSQNSSSNPSGEHPPGSPEQRNMFGLADTNGVVLVSSDQNYPVGSSIPEDVLKNGAAVTVNGKQVGTILFPSQPPGFNPQESQYLQHTTTALIFASLGAVLVALLLGILLTRTLTNPLKALTQAAHRISQGKLEQEVKVTSNDEIGQLATAFNRMSQEVAHENQLRRQMTADIAHDLRTPLTVISGYIESMHDGVLKPTPQRLALIYSEIERLQNMVGDLRMLSLAETGELSLSPQNIEVKNLLDRAASLFKHQAGQQQISIDVETSDNLPAIRVDEARMMQVFGNLITNSLRYTPTGGKITLSAHHSDGEVQIGVSDNGAGIPPEELPYIFDRFHRTDKSRHNEGGESGLGLSIVKALVELHGGRTSVESTPGVGTTIDLFLPTVQS
jgi:signal transduction histidine kinase